MEQKGPANDSDTGTGAVSMHTSLVNRNKRGKCVRVPVSFLSRREQYILQKGDMWKSRFMVQRIAIRFASRAAVLMYKEEPRHMCSPACSFIQVYDYVYVCTKSQCVHVCGNRCTDSAGTISRSISSGGRMRPKRGVCKVTGRVIPITFVSHPSDVPILPSSVLKRRESSVLSRVPQKRRSRHNGTRNATKNTYSTPPPVSRARFASVVESDEEEGENAECLSPTRSASAVGVPMRLVAPCSSHVAHSEPSESCLVKKALQAKSCGGSSKYQEWILRSGSQAKENHGRGSSWFPRASLQEPRSVAGSGETGAREGRSDSHEGGGRSALLRRATHDSITLSQLSKQLDLVHVENIGDRGAGGGSAFNARDIDDEQKRALLISLMQQVRAPRADIDGPYTHAFADVPQGDIPVGFVSLCNCIERVRVALVQGRKDVLFEWEDVPMARTLQSLPRDMQKRITTHTFRVCTMMLWVWQYIDYATLVKINEWAEMRFVLSVLTMSDLRADHSPPKDEEPLVRNSASEQPFINGMPGLPEVRTILTNTSNVSRRHIMNATREMGPNPGKNIMKHIDARDKERSVHRQEDITPIIQGIRMGDMNMFDEFSESVLCRMNSS